MATATAASLTRLAKIETSKGPAVSLGQRRMQARKLHRKSLTGSIGLARILNKIATDFLYVQASYYYSSARMRSENYSSRSAYGLSVCYRLISEVVCLEIETKVPTRLK